MPNAIQHKQAGDNPHDPTNCERQMLTKYLYGFFAVAQRQIAYDRVAYAATEHDCPKKVFADMRNTPADTMTSFIG